ncbi:MAG TPA: alkaline phosphatase family protein [Terriglobales bacterium]|nr:alkaline phosphatase family protein [Terriglobales bacterium]
MRLSRLQLRLLAFVLPLLYAPLALADGNINQVKHIIILVQENHSFDNYFGALAYAPGSPYHNGDGHCSQRDHRCIDGLRCKVNRDGTLQCSNSNLDDNGSRVSAFHIPTRCVTPDLNHDWFGTHEEINFLFPNSTLDRPLSDGFVRVSDATDQLDNGVESPTEDDTIGYYNQSDIPFYYQLASQFAVNDRYFASVLGPTFPNRAYVMAATSFGHLTTNDTFPPPGGYKPITGTILDLMDKYQVSWADYFQDAPAGAAFRLFGTTGIDPHFLPLTLFLAQAAGVPGAGDLPSVSFVDPNFGLTGRATENDEHPPTDIQRGQAWVSQAISAVRNGPFWKDTVIFITYDEHGGFYDHAAPPRAPQGGARTPDGISPGQCEDLSNPPASLKPGGGAECSSNPLSTTDTTVIDAGKLCPEFASDPTRPYPDNCASFDQLGVRVPFMAVSPFSKPHYVSHTIGDHTSLLAFIEQRFLSTRASSGDGDHDGDDRGAPAHLYLTRRDQHAHTLEDMFDFDRSPSLNVPIAPVTGPTQDCTP